MCDYMTSEQITDSLVSPVFFQLFDSTSLDHIKTFKTERPVNSAAISPIMDHVSEDLQTLCFTLQRWPHKTIIDEY